MKPYIRSLEARPLNARLGQTFAISSATQDSVASVLMVLRLSDGSTGYGECAPMRPFNEQTQSVNLEAVRAQADWLVGKEAARTAAIAAGLREALPDNAPVRAGIEMALIDALTRHWKTPLWQYFGGAGHTLETDYTISVGTVAEAAKDARAILKRGIRKIKLKIGRDADIDVERVLAVTKAIPGCQLILDANQAYDAARSLRMLKDLSKRGVVPDLFEQPVPREDWDGLKAITRASKVPVCADESVRTPEEAVRMVRERAARVVNVKIMKSGVFDAREIAVICRAGGLGLMIGGMVETRLAMTCAAHLAAGLGGFSFIDLDTPFFFARDPMKGPGLSPDGHYDLSKIPAGIGVTPLKRDAASTIAPKATFAV